MIVNQGYEGGAGGQFPVGMRVLAVDDDPICLKLLDTLLRKCRYHVTTTSHAIMALKLLRENKDQFDLVISDVHMPDMDGFNLLELVGLEMDLPVIMLSANDDTNLVMKGITHGACDYLLKPVRVQELKNIWQHVIRKKKVGEHYNENEAGQALAVTGDSDQNCNFNRKRKDQEEDDDEDCENELSNKDSSTPKKARLVWTGELHRKFVAAVRTLGTKEAVPKKILEIMNVEKLTRENVASHLQKYRKYLVKFASQQANISAALDGLDATYLPMTSLSGYGNLQNAAERPFISNGLLGNRLDTPADLPMHALPSPGTIQLELAQNLKNPINIEPKFQPVIIPENQNEGIFPGMPTSMKYEQLQLHNVGGNHNEPPPNSSAKSSVFPILGNVNQSSGTIPLPNIEFPSDLPDLGRCTDSWSAYHQNPFTLSDVLKTTIPRDSGNIFLTPVNSCTIPSFNGNSDLRADFIQKLLSEENNFSTSQNPNLVCNSLNSMISSYGVLDLLTQYNNFDNKNWGFSGNNDLDEVEIQSLANPQIMQQNEVDQSVLQTAAKTKHGYITGQTNPLGSYSYNNGGSLEDLDEDMFV